MQCYEHREESAIAVCRNCGKAVCSDCYEDTGYGIACSAVCSGELWAQDELKKRQRQDYGLAPKRSVPASVSTYFFFGLILSIVGVYLTVTRPGTDILTFAMAAVFFVMSAGAYKRYRDGCAECGVPSR